MTEYLNEYLKFYQKNTEPGYAVLVTGDWGSGKTYQIKKFLKEDEIYYVSLFGLQTSEEAHAAVIATVDPKLSRAKKLFSGLEGKAAASGHWIGALGSAAAGVVSAALRREVEIYRTLVFDDLERSGLDSKSLLGVINYYIEHQKARVIVIAHDKKLTDSFEEMNEKLFGQTIKIEPMIESAFESFKNRIDNKDAEDFICHHKDNILNIFYQSKVNSLRILRHVIEDISRLFVMLTPYHLSNESAMQELVCLFCAFNLELRNKAIKPSDFLDRRGQRIRFIMMDQRKNKEPIEKSDFVTANDRYSNVDLESYLISDRALTEMLVNGNYRAETICATLDESHYFIKTDDAPPWKIVMSFDNLPDDIVDDAFKKMEKQFIDRESLIPGEMLQIFSLKMMMSFTGIVSDSIDHVKKDCLSYIDDLLASDRLPSSQPEWRLNDGFSDSYDDRGYWVKDEYRSHFKEVRDHLVASMDRALQRKFPLFADDLLMYMKTDAMKFFQLIGRSAGSVGKYEYAPVLQVIKPELFVKNWMDSPHENWQTIHAGIENRYANGRIEEYLPEEVDWFLRVIELMEIESEESTGFKSLRIKRAIHPKLIAIRDQILEKRTSVII